jgi:hypothetical protein
MMMPESVRAIAGKCRTDRRRALCTHAPEVLIFVAPSSLAVTFPGPRLAHVEEELTALTPYPSEVVVFVACWLVAIAVAVASFRRGRCLSRYPIWKSLLIALAAGSFPLVWLIVSIAKRQQLAREWSNYRHERASRRSLVLSS